MIGPAKNKRGSAFARDSGAVSTRKTPATAEAWSQKRQSYKPLPTRFRRGGFHYRQIAREGNAAIYEQTWSGCPNPSISYEVIRIRRREGFQIGGRLIEPAELYPRSESWGTDGWTVPDKESAFRKLRKLLASSNAPAGFGQKRKRKLLEKSPT
jgi:hypothetical protein